MERSSTRTALTKVVLPAAEPLPALPDIDFMGINSYHLFSGLTGLAKVANVRVRLNSQLRPLNIRGDGSQAAPWALNVHQLTNAPGSSMSCNWRAS